MFFTVSSQYILTFTALSQYLNYKIQTASIQANTENVWQCCQPLGRWKTVRTHRRTWGMWHLLGGSLHRLCVNSENRSSQTHVAGGFFMQLSKNGTWGQQRDLLFSWVFSEFCSLLCPGTIWEFCLWDSWRDRANGKDTATSAHGLPSAF